MQVSVVGVVQGVGFRPFVFRLAEELGLNGWVRNDGQGVTIEVEGPANTLATFLERLGVDRPPTSIIYTVDHRFLPPIGHSRFEIAASQAAGAARTWILPDLATCVDCRREISTPSDRRHRYPFTNCTHCGPRFSIIEDLPYDRARISMRAFSMCERCSAEYLDPRDRRFHAQPDACGLCGPRLELVDARGARRARDDEALREAASAVRDGRIVAVKGLGGYHLVVDAGDEAAVATLRRRKRRPWKPFALMYPDVEQLRRHVHIPPYALPILESAQAPILLLEQTAAGRREIARSVAPGSPFLGVFLPYTPLHHVLLRDLGRPVVATSGNMSDEPIQFDDDEAFRALAPLCDFFLRHDRPIVRPVDDSVLHVIERPRLRPQMLRRARGYTPLPLLAPKELPPIVALGGHLNAAFAVSRGREIVLSQHLGDLESFEARQLYRRTLDDFLRLYDVRPEVVVHDMHPDYFTTALAESLGLPRLAVQHHHAHLAACLFENQLEGPALGLTWDGTGYGPDGTVWGGEFLLGDSDGFERVATLSPFCLPGGDRAVRESWRVALSLLEASFGEDVPRDLPLFDAVPPERVRAVGEVSRIGSHSPVTTSMGRLFDGFSALLGLSFENTHQAQSAQLVEYAAWRGSATEPLPFPVLQDEDVARLDWRELVRETVRRLRRGTSPEALAADFHAGIARAAVDVAKRVGCERVVLAGGVFANRLLTETLRTRLEGAGFRPAIHSQLPPTDGSLAVGQIAVACRRFV